MYKKIFALFKNIKIFTKKINKKKNLVIYNKIQRFDIGFSFNFLKLYYFNI